MSVDELPGSLQDQRGRTFPGGRFRVEPYEDWLMRDAIGGASHVDGWLHPLWAFAALQRSIGITLGELFALCEADASDGPVLGETDIELIEQLMPDTWYEVSAKIHDIQRKHGKRAGTIDVVSVSAEATRDGSVVARLANSYVFRRR